MAELSRDTELVLPPGTHAFVLDGTKGHISAYCGPYKSSLSNTDSLVIYNPLSKRFINSSLPDAIQSNVICPKGCYVVLENPASNGQPSLGKADVPNGPLQMGRTENLPGPQSFPLWPGQVATVVDGHHLRSNQYLVVRIADDEAAKVNWAKSVVQQAAASGAILEDEARAAHVLGIDAKTLVTGQHIIIKGTDVAFYIPPTGVEVLKEEISGSYIRDAETLERLEYAILLSENGTKEYRKGPDVVFPTPTQKFYTRKLINPAGEQTEQRKFRAFELQPTNGVHIKVIADYTENDAKTLAIISHKAGDELFITGDKSAIYYPREEHAIMSYGGNEKSYAVAIPSGEGRYVLNRANGDIDLFKGPDMFLPNPIRQVIVRRVLSASECELYFPGNREVLDFNNRLREDGIDVTTDPALITTDIARNFVPSRGEVAARKTRQAGAAASLSASPSPTMAESQPFGSATHYSGGGSASNASSESYLSNASLGVPGGRGDAGGPITPRARELGGDVLTRSTVYTPPRMITLDTKYDGAVRIDVWSGHAVQVVDSKGTRKTVIGPRTVLLEYDEYLERLSLSTGKPKTDARKINTPYLRYNSNPVSDVLTLKTHDLVDVNVQIKYLIRFNEADSEKWFSMDNYVQYLVDHLRSMIGNAVRNISVREFSVNATNILRDMVLGTKDEATDKRPLRTFDENGMVVYDLEVITITVMENTIATLLARSRQEALTDDIALERTQQKTVFITGQEKSRRAQLAEIEDTNILETTLKTALETRDAELTMLGIRSRNTQQEEIAGAKLAAAEAERAVARFLLEIDRAKRDLDTLYADATSERKVREETAIAEAVKIRMAAIAPGFIEALQSLALAKSFEGMTDLLPLSVIEGKGLSGTMETLFKGTPVEGLVENLKRMSVKA
jgi:major vault protein